MGFHIPSIQHEDIPALNLIQSLLSGGKSGRLHRALVETGIATACEAYGIDDKDPTLFVIGCNLQKGKKAAQAESIVMRELGHLSRQPMNEKEIDRGKNLANFNPYKHKVAQVPLERRILSRVYNFIITKLNLSIKD